MTLLSVVGTRPAAAKATPVTRERPDMVLVHGDTATVAASSAAIFGGLPAGQVEAGLRALDRIEPIPEKIDRRAARVSACVRFAPTRNARANLLGQGDSRDAGLDVGADRSIHSSTSTPRSYR
jgi:UDP-N-acetylglucosamine 2-epimerase (non-hydrolysing)